MGTSFENIIVPQVISLQDDPGGSRRFKKNGIVLEENSILREILRYN